MIKFRIVWGCRRDDLVGYCGGVVAECLSDSSVHLCPKVDAAAIHMPTSQKETGLVPAEMNTATNGPQEPSEEEDIAQSLTDEDAGLVPAEMSTAMNGPQEPSQEVGGPASMEVII